eukprot:scaffold21380_cov38-Attheya_sp.AAC.5
MKQRDVSHSRWTTYGADPSFYSSSNTIQYVSLVSFRSCLPSWLQTRRFRLDDATKNGRYESRNYFVALIGHSSTARTVSILLVGLGPTNLVVPNDVEYYRHGRTRSEPPDFSPLSCATHARKFECKVFWFQMGPV